MNILAVTLARGGSKSVPKKNIALLAGKPLIQYTIDQVKQSCFINDYIISTDDTDIMEVAQSLNVKVPFLRDKSLSQDTTPSSDALIDAVERYAQLTSVDYDIIVEVMCTNPLKTCSDIDACIETLISTPEADTCIAVHQIFDHHPARVKQIVDNRLISFCVSEPLEARRQDLSPPAYIRSGSIYAIRASFLMTNRARYGGLDVPYILPQERALNIDEPNDFMLANLILSNHE